ncbi:MAG TPA: hypothetical protein VLV46_10785, partial [Gaiellaceae bacterium]|nr:hypothetical protein [Gaiellaceae bacterium]
MLDVAASGRGGGDHHPAVGVAAEHDRLAGLVDRGPDGRRVVVQAGRVGRVGVDRGQVDRDRAPAVRFEQR